MTRACVVCGDYVPGSRDLPHERVVVHERCHPDRRLEARYGIARTGRGA